MWESQLEVMLFWSPFFDRLGSFTSTGIHILCLGCFYKKYESVTFWYWPGSLWTHTFFLLGSWNGKANTPFLNTLLTEVLFTAEKVQTCTSVSDWASSHSHLLQVSNPIIIISVWLNDILIGFLYWPVKVGGCYTYGMWEEW